MGEKLKIYKNDKQRGEDGYKVFSIRIKEEYVKALGTISTRTGRSRNELINMLIHYGLENCEIEGDE